MKTRVYKDDRESGVPWKIEAHRNMLFFYKGYGTKGSHQAPGCGY